MRVLGGRREEKGVLRARRALLWAGTGAGVGAETGAATCRFALQSHVGAWLGPGAERGDVCAGPISGLRGQIGGDGDVPWR